LSGYLEESREERKDSSTDAESGLGETISFRERGGKPGGGKGILIQNERTGAISTLNNQNVCYNAKDDVAIVVDMGGGKSQCGITKNVSPTLATTHGGEPVVFEPGAASRVGGHVYEDGKVGAIRANAGDNQQAIVVNNDPTYCIQGNCIDRADTAGCNGKGWREDASYTLNTIDRPAVVYDASRRHNYEPFNEVCETVQAHYGTGGGNVPIVRESCTNETISMEVFHCTSEEEKVQTLKARDFKDPQVVYTIGHDERSCKFTNDEITDPLTSSDYKDPIKVSVPDNNSIVRRLTPLECERLQGYPDGWTDIGEWVDSKGKKRKDSDSPRYKALGNSIALPFWQWMAHKMVKYIDGHQPTMASLFDGIGGFPLVFSRAGAKPIWASEIEEFPIAVTKVRFPEEEEEDE
jgi:DNA (cytosine-5)-methyltransferase 1